jgi:copper chaperone CopZ
MKKFLFFLLTLSIAFTLVACGENDDNTQGHTTREQTSAEQTAEEEPVGEETAEEPSSTITELTVWGMTCNRCVNKITNALSELNGIIDVSVDLDDEKVTVEHEPDLDIALIENIITGEGFNIP